MRGRPADQSQLFQYVTVSIESYVPADHPIRGIRQLADEALRGMQRQLTALYSTVGRPSIPPEQLLRALLLQSLYTIRSERQLVEQIHYNLLYRWFVGLELESRVWDFSTFSQNRERFIGKDIAQRFQDEILKIAKAHGLLSTEHFTVDGTLLEAAASLKSFVPKESRSDPQRIIVGDADHPSSSHEDVPPAGGTASSSDRSDPGNPDVNFHGQRRRNDTHRSTTDPEARLYKKGPGKEAKLAYLGHVLMENRNGLIVESCVTLATGTAERDAAKTMIARLKRKGRRHKQRITLGADKGYDTAAFVSHLREQHVTPHLAAKKRTTLDQRTLRHPGYGISQRIRKRVEETFGWLKTCGGLRKARFRGRPRVGMAFALGGCAYNLIRIANILEAG
jgi:transposase